MSSTPSTRTDRKLRVAVLMGGTSAERAISLSTGRQIMAALDPARYDATALDAAALSEDGRRDIETRRQGDKESGEASANLHSAISRPGRGRRDPQSGALIPHSSSLIPDLSGDARPDVVFIALHGKGGEDGTLQGALDLLGIPYTGSGVLASALAMDKARCNVFLRAHGIPVPEDIVLERRCPPAGDSLHARIAATFGYPVVVKPNAQGSTIGCSIVRDPEQLELAVAEAFKYDGTVLVEQFVSGVEITVGVLGNDDPEVLPSIEIEAKGGFYDYEAKYAPGGSAHVIPARISTVAEERARDYARRAHLALGCRGMSRIDMIVAGDQPTVLEVNTIPGMTPTSLLPDAARAAGIAFPDLLDRLIGHALEP